MLVAVVVVTGGVVDLGDALRGDGELAAVRFVVDGDEAEVEGGAAAVAGDLQHVVLGRIDRPVADAFGTPGEIYDVVGERVGGVDHDRLRLSASKGGRGEVEVLGGANVGDLPVEGE